MSKLTEAYTFKMARIVLIKKRDHFIEKLFPRRCMVVSVGLILAGLSIPVLMVLQILSITFLLGFVGFALVATGGVLALIFCGEI